MFDNAKMIANAYRVKKSLESEIIEIEENGIRVQIGGDQKIKHIYINDVENTNVKEAINTAIMKAQDMMAIKLKEVMGSMDTDNN